jgi:hypothetical protein
VPMVPSGARQSARSILGRRARGKRLRPSGLCSGAGEKESACCLRAEQDFDSPSGRHGGPPSSEHSPTRSVSDVCAFGPDGWGPERRHWIVLAQAVDPDGVGRARLGCSVRSPSGTRRRCRRAAGLRVGTQRTVGCSAPPASPEAGFAPRRRSKLAVAGCQVRACREDRLGQTPPLFRAGALAGSGGVNQRPVFAGRGARGLSRLRAPDASNPL